MHYIYIGMYCSCVKHALTVHAFTFYLSKSNVIKT